MLQYFMLQDGPDLLGMCSSRSEDKGHLGSGSTTARGGSVISANSVSMELLQRLADLDVNHPITSVNFHPFIHSLNGRKKPAVVTSSSEPKLGVRGSGRTVGAPW